jgi:hypothetical protein
MLPRDRSAIEDLRAVSRTPPPLRSESEFVGYLDTSELVRQD